MAGKPRRKKIIRKVTKRFFESSISIAVMSTLATWYLKFVQKTNSFTVEPQDILEMVTPEQPVIVAVWHGQHILMPAVPIGLTASVMISKSIDGEITANVVENFGSRTIRASGGRNQAKTLEKGGIKGFLEMLNALRRGENVVQTADVPKGTPRRVGMGIITLAQRSGRPIVPMAIASSRRYVFQKSWDKTAFNMPFGKSAICVGEMVSVKADSTVEELEVVRQELQVNLNQATKRSYELTGNPEEFGNETSKDVV